MKESGDESEAAAPSVEFVRQFTASQRALFLYILPLVGNSTDADEVLQETNIVIWAKWQQFRPGTNFLAWGRAIARLEVFRHRRDRSHRLSFLDDALLDAVARKSEVFSEESEQRREALEHCIEQLRPKDLQLLKLRYSGEINGDEVARKLGRPANSVYQSLGRIRRTLAECVRLRLAQEGGVS